MYLGQRVIYNKKTGKPLDGTLGKRFDSGLTTILVDELRPPIEDIGIIDLDFDNPILDNVLEFHIENGQIVVYKVMETRPTYEELEDQLLLMQEGLFV